jgi:hypothetical protein
MTLFYPDVSNNNWSGDQDAIDFLEQLIPQGFAGVVHKVSEGDYYEDPYWPIVLQWCQQNNVVCLGYHYVTEDDPASQAQTWLGNNGGSVAMADWEVNGGDFSNYQAVAAAFEAAGVTVYVGYCPQWYWSEVGEGDLSDIPTLISSAYPDGSGYASVVYADAGGDSGEGWDSYGEAAPTIWQFTDSADIPPFTGIDCNAFKGADLAAAFGLAAPTPAPTPAPAPAPAPTPSPQEDGFLSGLTQAQQEDIYNLVVLSAQQLLGLLEPPMPLLPGSPTSLGSGWAQLGRNSEGQNLTQVDALNVTETGNQSSLGSTVAAVQKAVGAPNPDTTGILNEITAAGGSGILGLLSGLIQSLPTLNIPDSDSTK